MAQNTRFDARIFGSGRWATTFRGLNLKKKPSKVAFFGVLERPPTERRIITGTIALPWDNRKLVWKPLQSNQWSTIFDTCFGILLQNFLLMLKKIILMLPIFARYANNTQNAVTSG